MLDIMRQSGYNYISLGHTLSFAQNAVFLFFDNLTNRSYPNRSRACAVSRLRCAFGLDNQSTGAALAFYPNNAKTATIRFAGKVTVSKRIITMCLRQEALYHRRFTPVNTFLKISQDLSQLNPIRESPGGLWQTAGDSAADSNLLPNGGFSYSSRYPRGFLSQSPVSTSVPGGSLPGTGGLSGGAR